jgi:hypothetical protein
VQNFVLGTRKIFELVNPRLGCKITCETLRAIWFRTVDFIEISVVALR